jgi:nucleobindin
MREHVFKEIDLDKDKMISLQEFLQATKQQEFKKNDEWKVSKKQKKKKRIDYSNFDFTIFF